MFDALGRRMEFKSTHKANQIAPNQSGPGGVVTERAAVPRGEEPFIVFGAPLIEEAEIEQVVACLRSGWIGTGPLVQRFESAFRDYRGAQYVSAVNSCTAALHLSLLAAGLGPGDEVITTAMTFCATVNAIIHAGATPVLADCDPRTQCLDPKDVERRLTPRTRALVPVHFAGQACDMDALMDIARTNRLKVVEDCAHSIETTFRGTPVGTFGDFGCYSFYVTKNVATGEGGMVAARRPEDADAVRVLALHGMSRDAWKRFSDTGYRHYDVVSAGFKYNMMDLQAAIGLHQLARVERNWARRRVVWTRYQEAFADLPIGRPTEAPAHVRHAYHLYTALVEERRCGITRDAFLSSMTARRIGVGVHYQSIPTHTFYRERYGWKPEDYPHSYAIGASTVSLPLSAKLTDAEVDRVIAAVRGILSH